LLVSRGQSAASQGLPAAQAPQGRLARAGIASLRFHQPRQLAAEERRHRQAALGGQDARFLQRRLVEAQGDVPRHPGT
jgi:hypothetical protein